MAKETPGQPKPVVPEEKPAVPSFNEAVEASKAARQSEIEGLATSAISPTEPASEPDAFDFDGEWQKLPERFRTEINTRASGLMERGLQEEYGDVLPALIEAKNDPAFREALKMAGSDPELRGLLSDPDFRRDFKKLTNKERRDFLFGEASSTFDKYAVPVEGDAPPENDRVTQLEARFEDDLNQRETQTYVSGRQQEMLALKNAFPQFDDGAIGHVITQAESAFETAALRKGVDTSKPGWAAIARRKGVEAPVYYNVAQQYATVLGRSAPPVAPSTSPEGAPPQAPRDVTEAQRKAAGVSALRNAIAKTKRPATAGRS